MTLVAKKELSENTFTHHGLLYDLTKVRLLTQSDRTFILPIKNLLWVLKWDEPKEERVLAAKLRYPLLVTREIIKGKVVWTVVDGLHRLERYRRRGITVIPVKLVDDIVLNKARLPDKE